MPPRLRVSIGIIVFGLSLGGAVGWIESPSRELLGGAIALFSLSCLIPVFWTPRPWNAFDARNAFVVFFALYTLPYPFLVYLRQVPPLLPLFDDGLVFRSMMLSLGGLIAFYVGYALNLGDRAARSIPLVPPGASVKTLLSAFLVLLIGGLLFAAFVMTVGGPVAYLQAGYLGLYRLEQGREYLAIGLTLLGTGLVLLYHAAYESRSRFIGALTWVLIVGLGTLLFAIGRRRYLLTLALAVMVYRHYRKQNLSVPVLLSLGGVGFLLFNMWGLLRRFPWSALVSREAWGSVLQHPLRDIVYTVAGEGEFSGAGVWLPQVISQLASGDLTYLYGLSYLHAPVAFIPRLLYPSRPPMLSEWYVATFYPEVAARGGGMGFFFLAETYLNFGLVGVLAVMVLTGIAFRCASEYLRRSKESPAAVLLYAAVISWIPSGIRVDFATAFKGFTAFYFIILLLALLYSAGWRRGRESVPEAVHG